MRFSLLLKISSIIIGFTLLLFIVLVVNNINRQIQIADPLFVEKAKATLSSIEASISNEQDARDKTRLLKVIQKNIWLDPDVTLVTINLLEGVTLLPFLSNKKIDTSLANENYEAIKLDKIVTKVSTINGLQTLEAFSPIHVSGKIIGTIQINFDRTDLDETVSESIKDGIYIYIGMLLVFTFIIILVLWLVVLSPVAKIRKGVTEIGNLNFKYAINVSSKDELGELASSINRMSVQLESALAKDIEKTRKLEELRDSQEQTIKLRTDELSEKVGALEKLNGFMVDRELKMIELKARIKVLEGNDSTEKDN